MEDNVVKPWSFNNQLNKPGNYGFDRENGVFRSRSNGWFIFAATARCKRNFGNATFTLLRKGDEAGKFLLKAKGEW